MTLADTIESALAESPHVELVRAFLADTAQLAVAHGAQPAVVGYELMVTGFALMTGRPVEEARAVIVEFLAGALMERVAAQGSA